MTLAALFASSCTRCRPLSGDTSPPLMIPRQHLHEPESRWPAPTMMPSPPSDYLSPYCTLASCRRQYAWNQIRFDSPHDDKAPPEPPGTCLVNHLASNFGHRAQISYTGHQRFYTQDTKTFFEQGTISFTNTVPDLNLLLHPICFLCLLRARRKHPPKNRNDSTVIPPASILQSAHVKDNMRQVLWKPQTSIAERWTFIQPSAPPIQYTCRQSSEIWKSLVFHFLTTLTAWHLINKLGFINKQGGLITDLYMDRSPLWKRIKDGV